MTNQSDPFVRVYYRVIDDPKFADVYDNDARLACWLRLLIEADGMWPAPAPIPFGIRRSAFGHLVSVGLVDLASGNRFRVHGMDAERGVRRQRAQDAAGQRWHSGRTASVEPTQSDRNAPARAVPLQPIQSNPARRRARGDRQTTTNGMEQVGKALRRVAGISEVTPLPSDEKPVR